MDWLYDTRTECYSVQTTVVVGDYLSLVGAAYEKKGGLSGQREALKTTTAKRIRARMVSDIRRGAVLPPVVIGVVVDEETFESFADEEARKAATIQELLPKDKETSISIIDGMQRTTAILEAVALDDAVKNRNIRVEFWLTKSVRAMVYRMLVLNTGQVPWTLGRQLSVVYEPLLKEIETKVSVNRLFTPEKGGRRVSAAEYAGDDIVELYIAFNLRKVTFDTKESLSDEFSRLDVVENVSDTHFQEQFYTALETLVQLDLAFSRYAGAETSTRFSKGRNIFGGQPARVGYIVAVAQHVLGRPGADRPATERASRMEEVAKQAGGLCERLGNMSTEELGEFLKLDVLDETLDKRVGQVGRYERNVFSEAFQVLIEEHFELTTMEPCWRAS